MKKLFKRLAPLVAPLAGARIEISISELHPASLPVAPLAGARIEICCTSVTLLRVDVAPLAGARIEI